MQASNEAVYETVYVVEDYYDGPRSGFADYQQRPHFYRSLYLDGETYDGYNPNEDRFELTPVPEKVVEWAVASHHLWLKWDAAYRSGKLPPEPQDELRILPEDRQGYHELRTLIEQHRNECSAPSFIVRGNFDSSCGVQWYDLDRAAA